MFWGLLIHVVVGLHLAFLLFVVTGGRLVRRWRWLVVPQLLAVAWGTYVEAMPGLRCPLTTLENELAMRAALEGYGTSFINHYLVPILNTRVPTALLRWRSVAWPFGHPLRRAETASGRREPLER